VCIVGLLGWGRPTCDPCATIIGQVKEVESVDYGSSCCVKNCEDSDPWKRVERNPCNVTLTVTETMKKPVYLYYKMTGYFQNHRRELAMLLRAELYVRLRGQCTLVELSCAWIRMRPWVPPCA
jgi:hypothetical protein